MLCWDLSLSLIYLFICNDLDIGLYPRQQENSTSDFVGEKLGFRRAGLGRKHMGILALYLNEKQRKEMVSGHNVQKGDFGLQLRVFFLTSKLHCPSII